MYMHIKGGDTYMYMYMYIVHVGTLPQACPMHALHHYYLILSLLCA